MDIQTILLIILLLLSINLILVGVYLVIVLKDVRGLIKKTSSFLDTAQSSFSKLSGTVTVGPLVLKTLFDLYKTIKKNGKARK